MTRTFEDRPATRERVPLLIGLVGASGSGKTFSALRLASGIQSVTGGEIFVIDTEARRALHYAGAEFKFRHIAMAPPFSPLDYLAAIEHCAAKGASVVIVDSMSHEHEGIGGVLEWHEAEAQRLAKAWKVSVEKAKMSAWVAPKQARRKLINGILQLPVSVISCFRAKQKLKIERGKDPVSMGWQAIAAEEMVFEQTVNALLHPGARGVPTWEPDEPGERQHVKLPGWARSMFADGKPLDEGTGAKLAKWAAGTVTRSASDLVAAYVACADPSTLGSLETERRAIWKTTSSDEKRQLKDAADAATARVQTATADPPSGWDPSTGEVAPEDEPQVREPGEEG